MNGTPPRDMTADGGPARQSARQATRTRDMLAACCGMGCVARHIAVATPPMFLCKNNITGGFQRTFLRVSKGETSIICSRRGARKEYQKITPEPALSARGSAGGKGVFFIACGNRVCARVSRGARRVKSARDGSSIAANVGENGWQRHQTAPQRTSKKKKKNRRK